MRRFPLHSLSAALLLVPIACGGAPKTPEEQFTYITDDGLTAYITGYIGPGGDVTIPQKIGKLRVVGIGGDAMTVSGFLGDQGALHNVTSVTIPHGVLNIDTFAFYGCDSMASVSIPNTVTNIGMGAFASCWSLTDVTIPDSVKTIGDGAFSTCLGLTNVIVGDGLTSLGEGAFAWTFYGLQSLYFKGDAPIVGPGVFDYTYSATVYCRQGTTGWEQFQNDTFDYIYGISTPVVELTPKEFRRAVR